MSTKTITGEQVTIYGIEEQTDHTIRLASAVAIRTNKEYVVNCKASWCPGMVTARLDATHIHLTPADAINDYIRRAKLGIQCLQEEITGVERQIAAARGLLKEESKRS